MKRLAPLVLLAALVVPAGCGSSSSSTSSGSTSSAESGASTGSSPAKAEFIAEADAICEATKAKGEPLRVQLEKLARKARGEEQGTGGISDGTRRGIAQALDQTVAIGEASLARLQALAPPKEGAGQVEAIFQKSESAFKASRAYAAALENHEDARAQAVAEKGDTETREAAGVANQYGFKACGSRP